jgi:DNA topoisomerase IA
LAIEDQGYLLVYPYDKWSNKEIPNYQDGEIVPKFEVKVNEGRTTAPPLLSEADLIALMDRHGIGTDATHAGRYLIWCHQRMLTSKIQDGLIKNCRLKISYNFDSSCVFGVNICR